MTNARGEPRPLFRRFPKHTAAALLCAALLGFPQRAAADLVPRWELGVGAAALWLPDYRGSDESRGYLLPIPYVVYRLDWLKVDREGVRTPLFRRELAELNLSLSATPPVRSGDNRAREGMSDLKPMVELGPSLNLHLWRRGRLRLDLRLPVRVAITIESHPRQTGLIASPFLNLDVVEAPGKPWRFGILAGPLFATRRHHQYFYGVSAGDARPDRPAYVAHGGYSGMEFLASLSRRFARTWIGAYARYDALQGAAFEDSPLVRRRHYASAGLAAVWIFGQSSTLVERSE
jgi:MipA family protein